MASAAERLRQQLEKLFEAMRDGGLFQRVQVVPLGLDTSPYPDRIVARPAFEAELAKRTLTNLYNQRPAWLAHAHETLEAATAAWLRQPLHTAKAWLAWWPKARPAGTAARLISRHRWYCPHTPGRCRTWCWRTVGDLFRGQLGARQTVC